MNVTGFTSFSEVNGINFTPFHEANAEKFNRRGHRLVVVVTAVVVIEEDMTAITIRTVVVIMKISQVLKRTIVWAT